MNTLAGLNKMKWSAWNNGDFHSNGNGYGFRIPIEQREKHFDRSWKSITIELEDDKESKKVKGNISKKTFWDISCGEVISKHIGTWLIRNGYARWDKNDPPKFNVNIIGTKHFKIKT